MCRGKENNCCIASEGLGWEDGGIGIFEGLLAWGSFQISMFGALRLRFGSARRADPTWFSLYSLTRSLPVDFASLHPAGCLRQSFSLRSIVSPFQRQPSVALSPACQSARLWLIFPLRYQPRILAKINGATMVASDSMMNFGVFSPSLPQVIFSLGTAPE